MGRAYRAGGAIQFLLVILDRRARGYALQFPRSDFPLATHDLAGPRIGAVQRPTRRRAEAGSNSSYMDFTIVIALYSIQMNFALTLNLLTGVKT